MAIILPDLSGLAQGISSAGSILGQALQQRRLQQKEEQLISQQKRDILERQSQYGSILENTLGALEENASPIQITKALTSAVNQGLPTDIANQYGTLYATLQKSRPNMPPGPEQVTTMANLFKKFGMPEEIASRNAELWANLTTGGQTEMAKLLVDQIARNQYSPAIESINYSSLDTNNLLRPEETQVDITEVNRFKFPNVNVFEDRTPKERADLKKELLKSNNVEYKDISTKIKNIDNEVLRYDQLNRLNETGKLPENFGRLNVNWTTGDINFPFLANEETQLFVKTINDFTVAAKDTYGSRVTNFELGAFMKRLPTLANSTEGRRLILSQMEAMKGLDRLYEDSLKKVYDHYGMQKIDRATAERIAEDLRADDEKELKKKFAEAINAQENFDLRKRAPEGHLPVRKPDGSVGYLPIDKVDLAKKKGWKIL